MIDSKCINCGIEIENGTFCSPECKLDTSEGLLQDFLEEKSLDGDIDTGYWSSI